MKHTIRACLIAFGTYLAAAVAYAADPLDGIRIEPEANVAYNPAKDYGGWLRMSEPYNRCFTVRDQVLADESIKSKLKVDPPEPGKWRCTIAAGSWSERYAGGRVTDPRELDIDHMVPLKEAHVSGAYLWPKDKRVAYANDLKDPRHLLAVSASENRKKGDKDPAKYMPPRAAFHCTYLRYWVAVKKRWDLAMDQIEANFVRQGLERC